MTVERKLAAILSADVVGYSRLMAEDEDETVRRIGLYRREITSLVEEHRGRVVDFTGDNFLAEFPTATDAVEAAAEIQRVIKARNAGVPPGRAMEFRIGIHLGEVRVEGERLFGDGVNIAARLEGLAEAGGVCVSGTVLEQIRRKLELDFDDLGEQTVKNIPDPVHAYRLSERAADAEIEPPTPRPTTRWVAAVATVVALAAIALVVQRIWSPVPPEETTGVPATPAAPLTAIAVLPFDDLSPGADQKWLANGMAEELTEALSRIEQLRVIGRTSSERAKEMGLGIAEIGELLDVGAIVEGSIRRTGDRMLTTAQFIRVGDESHLWSGRYERKIDDVFATQREIAIDVAEAIRKESGIVDTLSNEELFRYQPNDVRAYRLLKQASAAWYDFSEDVLSKSIDLALEALTIEPDYAAAHGILSHLYADLAVLRPDLSDELLPKARAAAEEALRLDPNEGSAHNRLGLFHMAEGDWTGAEARYQIAIQASPSHGAIRFCYGRLLLFQGRLDDAAVQFHKASDLEPLAPLSNDGLAYVHLAKGEYEEAIQVFQRIVELDPGNWAATWELPLAYHLNGMDDEAFSATLRWASDSSLAPPDLEPTLRRGFEAGGWAGMNRAAAEFLVEGGEPCPDVPGPVLEARTFARAGERDLMFECLEKLVVLGNLHPWGIRNLRHHPVWAPYRDDPRFTALLRRMNLAE